MARSIACESANPGGLREVLPDVTTGAPELHILLPADE